MKMYLPFGDWSDDGHGRYEKVLIDAPSMEQVFEAQKALKAEYGEYFFNGMADDYNEPYFSEEVWQALRDSAYPFERMQEYEENNDWSEEHSIDEALAVDPCPCLSLSFVIDAFIWLHNWKGAEITRLDKGQDIPMICNWTCNGFDTVGYGCGRPACPGVRCRPSNRCAYAQ